MKLQFHKSDKIVVDFNIALIVVVDFPALSDLDALHQTQEGGAVQSSSSSWEQSRIRFSHSLAADHDCLYLYVQGAKDCVELLKRLVVF